MRKNRLIISGIALVLYFIFIHNLGGPALLDSDETRYADMARTMLNTGNFTTLFLDGRIFWDKPPLFFWILTLSYKIFGINEFAVRIPSVLAALTVITSVFFAVRKTISNTVAQKAALILATSVEFVIFARVSILDMIFSAFITLSLLCGLMTYFVKEQNKKYFWWLFYTLSALGVLVKGLPAAVIPFGVMLYAGIWKKNLKEFFRPVYLLPGCIIFLSIALPWHIIMYKIHGAEFVHEYFVKHHLQRFAGSSDIGREHGILYYVPTFIVGFLPWTLPFLFGLKKLIGNRHNDFIVMNLAGFLFTFIFFSIAGTKLITYILLVYPFCAVLCAYMWVKEDYFKTTELAIKVTNIAFMIFALLVSCAKFYLPSDLYAIIKPVQIPIVLAFFLCSLFYGRKAAFISYVILIAFLSGFMMPRLFNIWFQFGQNDLMEFAAYAKTNNLPLGAYNLWERFSLQYYYGGDIKSFGDTDAYGAGYVSAVPYNNTFDNFNIVISNDNLSDIKIGYKVIQSGKKYSLIKESHE